MITMVSIPVGWVHRLGGRVPDIKALVSADNPDAFVLAQEIPDNLLEIMVPEDNYTLAICDEMPKDFVFRNDLRYPSLQESLWAIGLMTAPFERELCRSGKPIRFTHVDFRGIGHRFTHPYALQLVVEKKDGKCVVDVVHFRKSYAGYRLAYVQVNPAE